jgi:hypothetical protein
VNFISKPKLLQFAGLCFLSHGTDIKSSYFSDYTSSFLRCVLSCFFGTCVIEVKGKHINGGYNNEK